MTKKCPKCGHNVDILDLFCSRCGTKLSHLEDEKVDEISLADEKQEEIKTPIVQETLKKSIENFINSNTFKKAKKDEFFNPNFKINVNSFYFALFLFVGFVLFSLSLGIFLQKQNTLKADLKYKNFLSNPALIPILKEPKTYDELISNFSDTQDFLELYLKYSNDDQEKKEQVFIGYLNEVDKVSHIASENMASNSIDECNNINSTQKAQKCSLKLNKKLKNVGIASYNNFNSVYLYPKNNYIEKRFSRYLSKDLKRYLKLKSKYNCPVSNGINIIVPPKDIANKLYDFEIYLNKTQNSDIKDDIEETIYRDLRTFIFTPEIYATTTQEMKKEFFATYKYFIRTKKQSQLRSLIMSYLDKQRSYGEENFKNDYPYRFFETNNQNLFSNTLFKDIFLQLRTQKQEDGESVDFKYVYNSVNFEFREYLPNNPLLESEFILSKIDDNNNVICYANNLSVVQKLNIPKGSKLFMVNSKLYVYNKNKLTLYSITYNGSNFVLSIVNTNDISSIFPGVEVINIDSLSSYNVYLEKQSKSQTYIIISKHSQNWQSYILSAVKGNIQPMIIDNMFKVDSIQDVEVAFHSSNVNIEETSDNSPSYRFIIHTQGYKSQNTVKDNIINYDEHTAIETGNTMHEDKIVPNIMPKIENKQNIELLQPPSEVLEPPTDND